MNILLCTLGASWAVIPETIAFLDPALPLYRDHPQHGDLQALRGQHGLEPPDEVWVCTTHGGKPTAGLESLREWWRLACFTPTLRIWQAAETEEIASQLEGDQVRELLYRATLLASDRVRDGQLVLSLAGGRKTMSADLQRAGMIFGCHALLHVIAREPMSAELRQATPGLLAQALPGPLAGELIPLIVARGERSELLDVSDEGRGPVVPRDFPLPLPEHGQPCDWSWDGATSLAGEIARRERAGSRLLGNFLRQLAEHEHHANWRSLYRLPPALIERLRTEKIGESDEAWLRSLPKADLHRHLGGAIGLPAQRRVAEVVWEALTRAQQERALEVVAPLLKEKEWPWDWPGRIGQEGERSHNVAALLLHASGEQLDYNLYAVTEPRHALRDAPRGFPAYERPGELAGSAILKHPAAWEPYAREALAQAREEGLHYLELRGSPQKYADGLEERLAFLGTLHRVFGEEEGLRVRFIFIADRRKPETFRDVVELACRARDGLPDLVGGIDVAGDEKKKDVRVQEMADKLSGAFERCIPVTIHAGEGEEAARIWEAAYHLHADRIGHGLTLLDHPELLARFRDRGLALELCPTSNREVVGFRDPAVPQSGQDREYPLRRYWQEGLALTLCTDNPAISRTTLAREYLTAARMCGGLSRWDTLAIIRQGFIHAFLPAREREALLKETDARIYRLLTPVD